MRFSLRLWLILLQEIAIMKMMDHPNIIKLYESFEDIRLAGSWLLWV